MHFSLAVCVLTMTAFLTIQASAQEIHADLCMYGCPSGSPLTNDIITRDIYILSSNDSTKFADWVAYRITKDTIGRTQKRTWKPDPWLADDETLEPEDYDGAFVALKTNRGHQAPLASFTATPNWKATNYLSNITPQKSELNQGPWKKLEDAVRALAEKLDTSAVYVMTGPLYEREMPALPNADESHKVPSGYWKIISTEKNGVIKVAAFLFDQETERRAEFCEQRFISSVRMIESKTGLNFFQALPEKKQEDLETGPSSLLAGLGCPQ